MSLCTGLSLPTSRLVTALPLLDLTRNREGPSSCSVLAPHPFFLIQTTPSALPQWPLVVSAGAVKMLAPSHCLSEFLEASCCLHFSSLVSRCSWSPRWSHHPHLCAGSHSVITSDTDSSFNKAQRVCTGDRWPAAEVSHPLTWGHSQGQATLRRLQVPIPQPQPHWSRGHLDSSDNHARAEV